MIFFFSNSPLAMRQDIAALRPRRVGPWGIVGTSVRPVREHGLLSVGSPCRGHSPPPPP